MELRHLRVLIAVVEEGGFHAAARRLHTTQPPVSRTVAELEAELGHKLIERSPQGIALTVAGAKVLRVARRAVALLAGLPDALAQGQRIVRVLHVLPEYLQHAKLRGLPPLLARRNIRIDMQATLPSRVAAQLESQAADVAFVYQPFEHASEQLIAKPVLHDEPVLAVPITHPLATKESVHLKATKGETLLSFPRAAMPERYDEILGYFQRAGVTLVVQALRPSLRFVLEQVAKGEGIAVVPRLASETHDLPVKLVAISGLRASWTLLALTTAEERSATRTVVNAITRAFAPSALLRKAKKS